MRAGTASTSATGGFFVGNVIGLRGHGSPSPALLSVLGTLNSGQGRKAKGKAKRKAGEWGGFENGRARDQERGSRSL